jgi:integrase
MEQYEHENPLADPIGQVLRAVRQEAEVVERSRPRMPQESGVEAPRHRRPSENYFRLAGEDWVPEPIDDPGLPAELLAGAKQAGLSLRDQIVVRIAFESGARISEVLGLTVGDWRARNCNQEATAFSKGSRGRRVKFLRFSPETAKLLHRYVSGERKGLDPGKRSLEHLADTDPLFLSARRQPYGYKAFIPHWEALCRAVGVDLNVHGLRHFYVSQAMRLIYETSATQAEIQRRQEELVRYMAWRSPATLEAYEHYFQARRHAEIQDQLHARIYAGDARYERQKGGTASGNTKTAEGVQTGWDSLLALGGQRNE